MLQSTASPSKFESQATSSPSKLSVPTRKQRNQPSSRVHDIEFATEISTSLLSQVRHLQALLAEKEEALKTVTHEKSRLEIEAEGFNERLRSLDESEHRYKDENWNLETQIHELLAAAKEAADREKKLTHSLHIAQAEKSSTQKELDEIKLNHAKLTEDHTAALKHYEVELGSVKRNMNMVETERVTLQRKIEDLTGQNQELAKAVAHQRNRLLEDRTQARGLSDDDFETAADNATPEHSPPPSPIKNTPRHNMLESETLRSSLQHAHRMIQSLKGNIHREKTEKLELKRMLQDARDELELRRSDSGLVPGSAKRSRKTDSKEFKKPLRPGQLGGIRSSRSEIVIDDDTNWEEDDGESSSSPSTSTAKAQGAVGAAAGGAPASEIADSSDNFDTANEGTDAFETANERGTETEDFQTGHEDMSDNDELTETETGAGGTIRRKTAPLGLTKRGNRRSFQSTASTSGDEFSYEDAKTPTAQPQRLRLRVSRGGNRRSRGPSEEPQFHSSPPSFASSSNGGTPQAGQSLFAELGDLEGSDDESIQGTPSRRSFVSRSSASTSRPGTARGILAPETPPPVPKLPKLPMVDTGMMTEPWEPAPATPQSAVPVVAEVGIAGVSIAEGARLMSDKHASTGSQIRVSMSDAGSQWQDEQFNNFLNVNSQGTRPMSTSTYTSTYTDRSSQYDPLVMDEKLAKFPFPPDSRAHTPMADLAAFGTAEPAASPAPLAPPLSMSTIVSEHVEPIEPEPESPVVVPETTEQVAPSIPEEVAPVLAPLAFSTIQSIHTTPISPRSPRRDGVMIPRDESDEVDLAEDEPQTPQSSVFGSVSPRSKGKRPATPVIAEDDTRQSLSGSPAPETPESQRPFKELSSNTNERVVKMPLFEMSDEGAQTTLTSEQIDDLLQSKRRDTILAEDSHRLDAWSPPRGTAIIPAGLRVRKSQESVGSVGRSRTKMVDTGSANDTSPVKRPSSSRNGSVSSVHPPLPTDHKQVIAAAAQRTGSSNGGAGSMGPPLLPASAVRANPSFRPRTPNSQPINLERGGTTPRAVQSSRSEAHSPTGTGRSRQSSVSSFVSELDARFNMRPGAMPTGIQPGTDPRMINAITQTMIGEYLWKYTRKAGRGTMSENRHRRYFWVHPYTRTLYWSDHDPSQAGRSELKAKSVPIEAVRVVTDDNPMPPGLHRKSLVIMTPGRDVKFTATTGQRHETWFNALSYLLLRTGDESASDTAEVVQGLTRDDVDEFNPGFGNSNNNNTRRGPTSLSSYNSRTTRNESPAGHKSARASVHPGQASTSSRPAAGTLSRLSNYWKGSNGQIGSYSSRKGRPGGAAAGSIYEASEVDDSAEDLRKIIERQDRESDRLEDVRACCDGRLRLFQT